MKVICTKCGGTHVACEAMINPNDKSFRDYRDDAFLCGWCEDCRDGVVLSNVDEVKTGIEILFRDFCVEHGGTEPLYAQCKIEWKDESCLAPNAVIIKLSTDVDENTDEKVFFYCNGIEELKSLADFGGEDFVLTECRYLTNEI